MTRLIVIRHGETDFNREHRFQGQIDAPLNANGLEQARRLGQRLADEPLDVLLASDLQRAQHTAAAVASAQQQRGRSLAVHSLPLWREQSFGVLEGLDVPTIRQRHPQLWARWIQHEADYALPGGESNAAFYDRVALALAQLVQQHAGARVALVTHGGVLDMLWRRVHRLGAAGPRESSIPNTALNRLHWTGSELLIERWADDSHLAGLPEQPSTAQTRVPAEG